MKTAFGHFRRRVFGLSPKAVGFRQRGFREASASVRKRLEQVGGAFLAGYHLALESDSPEDLDSRLSAVDLELRGFAFEGAAMGLALLDLLTPWRRDRLGKFLQGAGGAHAYMIHVGVRSEERRVGKEGRSRWSPSH